MFDRPKEENFGKEVNLLILTTSLKLELNSSDEHLLRAEMEKYIACVNSLVALHLSGVSIQKFSSLMVAVVWMGGSRLKRSTCSQKSIKEQKRFTMGVLQTAW